jgi:hypothetical protein
MKRCFKRGLSRLQLRCRLIYLRSHCQIVLGSTGIEADCLKFMFDLFRQIKKLPEQRIAVEWIFLLDPAAHRNVDDAGSDLAHDWRQRRHAVRDMRGKTGLAKGTQPMIRNPKSST